MAALISVEHLTMRFGGLVAIDDVSFSANDAEITAIGNGRGRMRAEDHQAQPVILFTTEWDLRYAEDNARDVTFASLAGI